MCFALLEGAGDCAKAIAGAICCCLCAGPVLAIIGIVLLVGENTREEDVESYNTALASYETNTAPILRDLTVTVEGSTMGRSSERVPVEGSMDDVNEGTHIVFRAANVDYATNDNYQFTFSRGAASSTQLLPASSSVTQNIPRTATVTRDIRCTQATCDRSCGFNDYECSASSSARYCSSEFGGSYTHTRSGDCEEGETCGRCTYNGELSKACSVVTVSSSSIADSGRYASCYYPFSLSGNDYVAPRSGSSRSSATMEVMSADDPFIALQRITEGSNNFGISEAQQRVTGAVLLVLGLLITCGMVGAAVMFYRHHEKKKQQRTDGGGYPPNQGNGGMYNGPAHQQQQPHQHHHTEHQQVQQPAQYDNNQNNGYNGGYQQQQPQYGNNQNNGYNGGGQPNYPQPQQQGYNGGGYNGGNKVQPV